MHTLLCLFAYLSVLGQMIGLLRTFNVELRF